MTRRGSSGILFHCLVKSVLFTICVPCIRRQSFWFSPMCYFIFRTGVSVLIRIATKFVCHFTSAKYPIFDIFFRFTVMFLSSSLHGQIFIWIIILFYVSEPPSPCLYRRASWSILLFMFYLFSIGAYKSPFLLICKYNVICSNLSFLIFLMSKTAA